jgi:hypothetical protein
VDYQGKVLKALYRIVELLETTKKQNDRIIRTLETINEINADAHGYVLKDEDGKR